MPSTRDESAQRHQAEISRADPHAPPLPPIKPPNHAERHLARLVELAEADAITRKRSDLALETIATKLELIEQRGQSRNYYGRLHATLWHILLFAIIIALLPLLLLQILGVISIFTR